MSHCSTFAVAYSNKKAIFSALRALGMQPSAGVVSWYSSEAQKRVRTAIGLAGGSPTRAILAHSGDFTLAFVMADGTRRLMVEHPRLNTPSIARDAQRLAGELARAYVRECARQYADQLVRRGVPGGYEEIPDGARIYLDDGSGAAIVMTVSQEGQIREEVVNVRGAVCRELTAQLDEMIQSATTRPEIVWKPEYYETVDETQVQILRLLS